MSDKNLVKLAVTKIYVFNLKYQSVICPTKIVVLPLRMLIVLSIQDFG